MNNIDVSQSADDEESSVSASDKPALSAQNELAKPMTFAEANRNQFEGRIVSDSL